MGALNFWLMAKVDGMNYSMIERMAKQVVPATAEIVMVEPMAW